MACMFVGMYGIHQITRVHILLREYVRGICWRLLIYIDSHVKHVFWSLSRNARMSRGKNVETNKVEQAH